MMRSGIYGIHNTANNKWYIGQTNDLGQRKRCHWAALRHNRHFNHYLQYAFNKHGEESFEFIILEECVEEVRDAKEKACIIYYKSTDSNHGYNSEFGGNPQKRLSEEHRRKISESLLGNQYRKGIPHTEETKRHLSETLTGRPGRPHTKEMKELLSRLAMGHRRCAGRKLTEEQKRQISITLTGRKQSAETKLKRSLIVKNRNRNAKGQFTS